MHAESVRVLPQELEEERHRLASERNQLQYSAAARQRETDDSTIPHNFKDTGEEPQGQQINDYSGAGRGIL